MSEQLKQLWAIYAQSLRAEPHWWDGKFESHRDYETQVFERFMEWLENRPDLLPVI